MDELKINWFPGHMAKASKDIVQNINFVDLILEVVDCRAIKATSNPIFTSLSAKPVLKVGLKSDLADIGNISGQRLVIGSTKDKGFRNRLLNEIHNVLQPIKEKKQAKGIANPVFYLMIVGLPNVGKSSLINFLANKNLAPTGNQPALTKNSANIKIDDNLYLQDNPGIFVKTIENINEGYILALVNTIKKDVLPLKEVLAFAYKYLLDHYSDQFNKHYGLTNTLTFDDFIKWYGQQRHFVATNNELDTTRTLDAIFDDFVNGKVCKVNYEK